MTYKEHIWKVCKNTDLKDEDDVTETIAYLAGEVINLQELAMDQEAKLKEIMTAKDFEEWSNEEAKKIFKRRLEGMEDSEYKEFCLQHFDEITGGNNA